jgi:nicotinamide phosphoribosyltransferase
MSNLLRQTDSYKLTHWGQYPQGTEIVYSYLESRGGQFDNTVFFGLQYYLKKYLEGVVFHQADIEEMVEFSWKHLGNKFFNEAGWRRLYASHRGVLPIKIRAVPEGTVVGTSNVLMTIENTDPEFPWLTNYLESLLLKVWYPTTVATLSREIKRHILKNLDETGDPSGISFKLHDFGYRGVSSEESAAIGGAAHLVNFMGTDTLEAIEFARKYYQADMPGFSVPATEHSTMTSWGESSEILAVANALKIYPEGIVSIVGDSWDIYRFASEIVGTSLREAVLARNGKLVLRPDSGDPNEVVPKLLDILGEKFGYSTNDKGFKVLNPKVGIIQGDGMNYWTCRTLFDIIKSKGWSGDNLVIGMGGKLLQGVDRDTQKFAFKCSAVRVNGKWQDVYKQPKTDAGKNSKRGRLILVQRDNNEFVTLQHNPVIISPDDELRTVFEDGYIKVFHTFDEVRMRAHVSLFSTASV